MGPQLHTIVPGGPNFMRLHILGVAILTVATLSSRIDASRVKGAAVLSRGAVRAITTESGVIPSGTSLIVRTNDTVKTHRAFRSTAFMASVAEEVLDQNGAVLIPKESPAEMVVRSLSYLGPGGAGMSELRLELSAVTVHGVRYSVDTDREPLAGGLGLDNGAAKWIAGREASGRVLTRGRRINVPTNTVLAFQIEDPIRLRGYQR